MHYSVLAVAYTLIVRSQIRDLCAAPNDSFQTRHCGWLVVSVVLSCARGEKINCNETLSRNTIYMCTTFKHMSKFTGRGFSRLYAESRLLKRGVAWEIASLKVLFYLVWGYVGADGELEKILNKFD